jgi:hypothetical protein
MVGRAPNQATVFAYCSPANLRLNSDIRGVSNPGVVLMTKKVKPLEHFDFSVVQRPLDGLLRNMDSDLRRRLDLLARTNDLNEIRRFTLLQLILRFAINSYHAVAFLLSDLDDHPRRQPRFVLVVPPINRQLMDLWFSLVFMMDDFGPRALAYDQCGYRELREQVDKMRKQKADDPEWQDWFHDMWDLASLMEKQIPLTTSQIADPSSIDYWLAPYKLARQPTKSQSFLKFLEDLLYHDTSAEAHLKPGGLFMSGSILLADIAPEELRRVIENRTIHQYKFRQYCRTVLTLLGIASEIELYCKMNNHEQLTKVWTILAGYNADTKDVYEARYQALLG